MSQSKQEDLFDRIEKQAVETYKEAKRIEFGDNALSVSLMKQANEMANDVKQGRSAYRTQQTSYTPEEVPQEEVVQGFEGGIGSMLSEFGSNAKEQHNLATENGMTKNLTVPAKLSKFSDNIMNPEEVGPDEYMVRQVANTVVPALADATVTLFKGLGQTISNEMPDEIETRFVESAKRLHYDTVRTPWFLKAEKLFHATKKGYDSWAKTDPEKASLFEDTMSTATMMSNRIGIAKALEKKGTDLSISSAQSLRSRRLEQTADILSPVKVDVENNQHKWDTSGGGEPIYLPDASEMDAAFVVSKIKGWDPQNSIGKNNKLVQAEKRVKAERLEKNIMDAGNPSYGKNHIISQVKLSVEDLRVTNAFQASKGGQGSIDPMLLELEDLVANSAGDARGLLQLRRDFDKWADKDMGIADFDKPDRAKVQKVIKEVRTTLNNELIALVPDVPVANSLRTQTALYNAGNRTAAKYDATKRGFFASMSQGLYNKVGVKLPATVGALAALGSIVGSKVPMLGGIGMVGGAAAGAGVGLLTAKALRSPKTRQALGDMVVFLSKSIDTVTDPVQKSMMRADRALVLDMLSEGQTPQQEDE